MNLAETAGQSWCHQKELAGFLPEKHDLYFQKMDLLFQETEKQLWDLLFTFVMEHHSYIARE